MRSFTIFLALLIMFELPVCGQNPVGKKAFYLHSIIGANSPRFDRLNNVLERSGYLQLPSVYFARGGGFYAFFQNTRLVQLFTFSTYTGTAEADLRRSSIRGTQIGTALGIDLRRRTRLQAIPYAGAAYTLIDLRVSNTGSSSAGFLGYLSGPANQYQVTQPQWLANLGLHLGASPVGKSGFAQKLDIALRGGYYLPMSHGQWKTGGERLGSGPEVNTGGIYAGLVLGIRQ